MCKNSIWDEKINHGEILKRIWKHLDLGVIDRDHPFHTPVLATVSGNLPKTRVVILRRFWRKNPRRLAFHTHTGALKVEEIRLNPNISWLFYHPQEKLQVKISGVATVHTADELTDEQWQATGFFSRRCYLGEAPSQITEKPTSGLPKEIISRQPTAEESEKGRQNFAVISTTIDTIDCLELEFKGNRRSLFVWNEKGELQTKWLTP